LLAAAGFAVFAAVLLPATAASAHPLGNFSVNQLDALDLYPDRITVAAAVDIAELPTLQERGAVDRDSDGTTSDAERSAYARTTCGALANDLVVRVDGHPLHWTVGSATFGYVAGAAGLSTSRLECSLSSPARLTSASTVDVDNRFRSDRIGWREMTAVGHGVRLLHSPLPSVSVSDNLRSYPKDLLSSPLNVRTAHLSAEPGNGSSSDNGAATSVQPSSPGGLAGLTAKADRMLEGLVGGRHLTPLVGMLAVLLAIALGAGHAALPGHGKTIMAVYLTGQAGRARDALGVAATVTLTHTGGVIALGLVLTTAASVAGEQVLGWLGVVSGLTVAAVGVGMLVDTRRRLRRHNATGATDHHHRADHDHADHGRADHDRADHDRADHDRADHDRADHGSADHDHAHGSHHHGGHDHSGHVQGGPGRLSIVGMGIAGGLVPSPSALIVLLGAIGLGRTGFGVLLVLAYGMGMAATLTAAGLALVVVRRRWAGRLAGAGNRWAKLARLVPTGTAMLVLLVGVGLAGRALAVIA
jgi:ABC-type nickel/cobalt efflux system permease component RcnA